MPIDFLSSHHHYSTGLRYRIKTSSFKFPNFCPWAFGIVFISILLKGASGEEICLCMTNLPGTVQTMGWWQSQGKSRLCVICLRWYFGSGGFLYFSCFILLVLFAPLCPTQVIAGASRISRYGRHQLFTESTCCICRSES